MVADLVIRNGTVIDGSGAEARRADVAIVADRIVEVGPNLELGQREIDAEGLVVTPGFIDPHTHFDGQATWDPWLAPSSNHGVTTVAMGNCGVGFAPVAPERHDWLIEIMEGVEDIPGTALYEGLRWEWESFPEYLEALERQTRTIDVAAHVPHAALRGYVMGEPGADPDEHPSDDQLERMARLLGEAIDAGAIGLSTSRTYRHRSSAGANLGTLRAREPELMALASVLRHRRAGVFQFISDSYRSTDDDYVEHEFELVREFARQSMRPISFSVQQDIDVPDRWRDLVDLASSLCEEGFVVKTQVAPRPIGVMLGLEATRNVFSPTRAYRSVADLDLDERVRALGDPDLRRRILESHADLTGPDAFSGNAFYGRFDDMFILDDPVNYDLDASESLGAQARAMNVDPREFAYDVQLRNGGKQMIYAPLFNFAQGNLDAVREMITSPVALFGLSDAGAHCGQICDASMTTSYLTTWARDRDGSTAIPLAQVVHQLTRRPALHFGWRDRGLIAPGLLADLNVIDVQRLGCHPPEIVTDLPAGGRRLIQRATGYRWTLKRGVVTFDNGVSTGELPGRLVRAGHSHEGL